MRFSDRKLTPFATPLKHSSPASAPLTMLEQVAAQDRWQRGTKVWLTGLQRAELNGAEGIIQGDETGRGVVQLDYEKGGKTVAVTHDHR